MLSPKFHNVLASVNDNKLSKGVFTQTHKILNFLIVVFYLEFLMISSIFFVISFSVCPCFLHVSNARCNKISGSKISSILSLPNFANQSFISLFPS